MWRVARRACVRGSLGTSQILDLRGRTASTARQGPVSTPASRGDATIVDKHVTTLL